MPRWTTEQQQAIDSRNGTILVSAAAGSGKTTVLVERVIRRLEDKINPCTADRLLVVTFTKAAAAQMKDKIARAIDKRIELDPENEHLIRQRMLLPFANISTIDSFCSRLVRENFQQLGIAPDFKMLEQAQLDLMMNDALDKVIEDAYQENSPEFRQILELLVSSGNDSKLGEIILSFYHNSRAFPFPDRWLDSVTNAYDSNLSVGESVWGRIVIDKIASMINYCFELSQSALDVIADDDPDAAEKFRPLFTSYVSFFSDYLNVIETSDWQKICDYPHQFDAGRIPRADTRFGPRAKAIKAEIVDVMTKRLPKLLCCNEAEFKEDIEFCRPVIAKIVDMTKAFCRELSAIKAAANGVDFSDVVDYAVRLLVEDVDKNGNPVKTDLAGAVSQQFDEILIDEFQDINETQNLLFKAVSDDEKNLFMVGDVKQSIYRFRQAMPEIFLKRRSGLETYVDNNYPAKISLDYNFRSRQGVTDFVNFVFYQLMSKAAGELDYDESEALKPKADYPDKDCADAELHIVCDANNKVDRTFEAEYIARYIRHQIDSGLRVKDGDGERKAQYKDFCILLRSTKNKAEIYSSVLTSAGIPCHVTSSNGFFDATEIKTVLSMIRSVDNPQQDIPLVATMLSPSFGFTPDELAELRINSRGTSYYTCVKSAADNGNKKCLDFLNCLSKLRTLSATLGAGDFVRELLDVTGYDSLVCAMANGSQRRANLNLLLDYAEKYEQSGNVGISGFIRFIDRVEKSRGDMEVANEISESADVVRIMSIHKSKGLEFPVCILADCSSKFNDDFLRSNIVINSVYGAAFKRVDSYKKFDTLPYKAVQLEEERANRSEELRVLYVALTRAKERLVCIVREDNPDKKLEKLISFIMGKKLNPYRVINSKSIGEWLLLACVTHPDFNSLPDGIAYKNFDAAFRLAANVFYGENDEVASDEDDTAVSVDQNLLNLLAQRLSYSYPYGNLSDVIAKISPSQIDARGETLSHFASKKPDFASVDGINPASKGTAVHKFMEFYDYSGPSDVAEQAKIMLKNKKLSAAEESVLDYKSLSRFFESETAAEIKSSSLILREKKVTFTVPAGEIYPHIVGDSADEPVLVQGYIDCAFLKDDKWVIVDYKTDKVKEMSELTTRYYNQLKMYENALSQCTGIPVEKTLIYSLYLGDVVEI